MGIIARDAKIFAADIADHFTLIWPDLAMLAINGGSNLRTVLIIPGRAATSISAISAPVKFPEEK